jgi:transcriptional/translational regulatory protein YebC/TACO1
MLGEYPACDHLNIALMKLLENADENKVAIQEILYAITKSNGYFYDHVKDELLKKGFAVYRERRTDNENHS